MLSSRAISLLCVFTAVVLHCATGTELTDDDSGDPRGGGGEGGGVLIGGGGVGSPPASVSVSSGAGGAMGGAGPAASGGEGGTMSSSTASSASSSSAQGSSSSSSSQSSSQSSSGSGPLWCDPMNPSPGCGIGQHCVPAPNGPPSCSGPVGFGTQYDLCLDNGQCAPVYECVTVDTDSCCLSWCIDDFDCGPSELCVPLDPATFVGATEYGVCWDGFPCVFF